MTISLSSIGQMLCSATSTNEYCGHANGTATAVPVDTCPTGFTYFWNTTPVQTTATAVNLPAGTYTVTITCGAQTCITSASVMNMPGPMVIVSGVTHSVCGAANGGATVTASGGVPPYTFHWSNGQNGTSLVNVMAGTYTVTVTDSVYCQGWAPVVISDTQEVNCAITNIIEVSDVGGADGFVFVTPSGGIPPYTYLWNTVPAQTDSVAANVPAGTYTVTVCDVNNCCCTNSATVHDGAAINEIDNSENVSVFPNPTTGIIFIDLKNIDKRTLTIEISDIVGKIVFYKVIMNDSGKTLNIDLRQLTNGFYALKIYNKQFVINEKMLKE